MTLWDVATGRELPNNLVGHTAGIQSVAFSPDGRALASGSRDGTVIVWDVADPAHPSLRHRLEGNAGAVWAVAYSPDGKTIASGNDDGTVKLWDPATGRERCTLVGHTAKVGTLAFSPDGSVLATGDAQGHDPPLAARARRWLIDFRQVSSAVLATKFDKSLSHLRIPSSPRRNRDEDSATRDDDPPHVLHQGDGA